MFDSVLIEDLRFEIVFGHIYQFKISNSSQRIQNSESEIKAWVDSQPSKYLYSTTSNIV